MKLKYLFPIFCILFSCKDSRSNKLAERMAHSSEFIDIMKFGKEMANNVKNFPDSVKLKMKESEKIINAIHQSKDLNEKEKRDSLVKLISSTPLYRSVIKDAVVLERGSRFAASMKKFHVEFPEYKKLSKEERSAVFKKATEIYRKNNGM